jgi:hypothetical protein
VLVGFCQDRLGKSGLLWGRLSWILLGWVELYGEAVGCFVLPCVGLD